MSSIFSSVLEKKGRLGIWSKRYCQLVINILKVFKDESHNSLDFQVTITSDVKISMEQNNCFKISNEVTTDETYIFRAENKDLQMRWVLALRGCMFINEEISMSNFKILSVIGRGHYGKVMLCQDLDSDELVAIKSVHKQQLVEENKVHTILTERNILSKAKNPFIVGLRFAFQTPSKFYLGMEYIPGGELFYHMQKNGNINISDLRLYLAEIAIAINHLHSIGVVHRDLKPENILLDSEGHIKLTDFGLSKDMDIDSITSTFCGTSDYIAPEIVLQKPYDKSVDWWAYGILAYELMFNTTPFNDPNRSKLYENITTGEVSFPSEVSNEFKNLINILLQKDPKKRASFNDVRNHEFFKGLDFNDVENKKFSPSFVPEINQIVSPENFDETFTGEKAVDSFCPPVTGPDQQVAGFSYTDQNDLDSSVLYNITNLESNDDSAEENNTGNINEEGVVNTEENDDNSDMGPSILLM